MAFIIRANCNNELDFLPEPVVPMAVCLRDGRPSITSEKFATRFESEGHASAVAAEYDGALIAKYGRRVWEFEVVPV